MDKWKLLSSAYICKEPWATLRRDTCELPDGRINDHYYVLEYPDWVNMIGITEQNELLVIKQYRHGAGIIALEIPAGTTEAGEDPKNAAVREMLEETGYRHTLCQSGDKWQYHLYLSDDRRQKSSGTGLR